MSRLSRASSSQLSSQGAEPWLAINWARLVQLWAGSRALKPVSKNDICTCINQASSNSGLIYLSVQEEIVHYLLYPSAQKALLKMYISYTIYKIIKFSSMNINITYFIIKSYFLLLDFSLLFHFKKILKMSKKPYYYYTLKG